MNPREFAIRAHGDQKYGGEPYVVHLDEVANIACRFPKDEEGEMLRTVAYLHDVLEDTEIERAEISELFGEEIAEAVAAITDPKGKNRRERKAKLNENLSALDESKPAHRAALIVKVSDRLANVRACVESGDSRLGMYRKEHEAFCEAAYRHNLCPEIWHELAGYMNR